MFALTWDLDVRRAELKRSPGFSVISVLVATAIVSIALSGVLFVVDLIATTVARNNAEDAIEAAVRTVQGIVTNRDLCNNALRGANGSDKIEFNPVGCGVTEVNVNRILLQKTDDGSRATMVLNTGGNVGFGFRVSRMFIREKVPCEGRGTINVENGSYRTYAAELVMEFTGDGSRRTLGGVRSRAVPINIVTAPGPDSALGTPDDVIDRCYQDTSTQHLCEQLGGSYEPQGGCRAILQATDIDCQFQLAGKPGEDCPPAPDPATNVRCQNFYYVVGFGDVTNATRPNARPICKCQRICRYGTGPVPPPGPGAPGAPGGFPSSGPN